MHGFLIDRALRDNLQYVSLVWHPWSLHRFDPEMSMLWMIIGYTRERGMPVLRFSDLYHSRVGLGDLSTSMKTVTERYRTAV